MQETTPKKDFKKEAKMFDQKLHNLNNVFERMENMKIVISGLKKEKKNLHLA